MKLEVCNLTKSYGTHLAVNDLSFQINPGQIFGIIGPNGSGKTTTLKIIEGILAADRGHILFDGKELSLKQRVRLIGVQLQDNTLLDYATVQEMIAFFSHAYKRSLDDSQYLIKAFAMENLLDKRVNNLSIGQQRSLCILLSFMHQPSLVILDEPSSGLDPKSRILLWNFIKEYTCKGDRTVIITTHLMEEAEELCDSVIFIIKGKKILYGNPRNLRDEHFSTLKVFVTFSSEAIYPEQLIRSFMIHPTLRGNTFTCQTNDPHQMLSHLLSFTDSNHIRINSLNMRHSTLEEIYLQEVNLHEDD